MGVTEIRPAADSDAAQWLLRSDVDWWDLVRYGPPGFDVYVRIAFPQDSGADAGNPSGEAPADALRAALTTLASYTATPFKGYAAIWEGWVSGTPAPRAPRVEIPNRMMLLFTGPVEALRDAQLWLGTALQQAHKNRTSCGRRIKPGVWPARSTRRSSSPWGVPRRRPRLWLELCRVLFDECVTGNRLRCTATRPSPLVTAPIFRYGRRWLPADRRLATAVIAAYGQPARLLRSSCYVTRA